MMELKKTGDYSGLQEPQFVVARKGVEDIIGLEAYYRIEQATVERARPARSAKRARKS